MDVQQGQAEERQLRPGDVVLKPARPASASSFVITVRAKPRSSISSFEPEGAGSWVARLRASPVDGKANAELIGLIAKHFDCPKSSISVISGVSARLKLVRISGVDP